MKKFLAIFTAIIMAVNTFAQTIDQNTAMANYSSDALRRLITHSADTVLAPACDNCAIQRQQIIKILNEYRQKANWNCAVATADNLREFFDQSEIIYGNQISGVTMMYKVTDDGYGYSVERYFPSPVDKFIAFRGMPFIKIEGRPLKPIPRIVRSNMDPPVVTPVPMVQASAPVVIPQTQTVTAQAPVAKSDGNSSGCNVTINVNQPAGNYGTYSTQQVVPIGYTIRGIETRPYIQPSTYGVPMGGYGYGYGSIGVYGSVTIGSSYPYGYGYPSCNNYQVNNGNCNQPVVTYGTNCGATTGSTGGVYPRR